MTLLFVNEKTESQRAQVAYWDMHLPLLSSPVTLPFHYTNMAGIDLLGIERRHRKYEEKRWNFSCYLD